MRVGVGPRLAGAIGLVLAGAALGAPVVAIFGLILGGFEIVRWVGQRGGLAGVRYSRTLATNRISWGDEIELRLEVWNRKPLPLAWLRATDELSTGVEVRRHPGARDQIARSQNTWTLAPYERVVRHLWVTADRRGVHSIGPTSLSAGDLLAREAASDSIDSVDRFVVWPRVLPAPGLARPDRWGDLDRAARGLLEDPARFAGVRPYAPGDALRRIHARTSARLGKPVTKRFEPSRERQLLLAVDVQTGGTGWDIARGGGDEVEGLYIIAASLIRSVSREGASFGLTVAGFSRTLKRFADVPIGQGVQHADRILDVLARLSPYPSAPFETLLARIGQRYRSGTTVLVLSARDPAQFARPLHSLGRQGFGVVVLASGPAAGRHAAVARRAGFGARVAQLDGPWQLATRVRSAA
jgi:uncharacterized protein (DUF58 family)